MLNWQTCISSSMIKKEKWCRWLRRLLLRGEDNFVISKDNYTLSPLNSYHGPLTRNRKWWVAHAPGIPGTFSLPPTHSHLVLMSDVPVWFSACLLECIYKTSYPSLECAYGGRAERPQMVYANDNTSLIHQVKFRRNRYPWAHPLWFVEWSSKWWPMHLWPGLTK